MGMHELRELTRTELVQKKNEAEDERFNLMMRKSFKALDNPLRLRHLRREVARINTVLAEDEQGIRKLAQSKTSILDEADSGKKAKE
ncbi:MAG: 50S ribosomal protein L29 [candidate division Zixibacteria bacterium]|nr:50S ribosomal protein L29 [candidate division Zixibacteria bacterium]